MKVKGPKPPVPPPTTEGVQKADVKTKTNQVANALAGLVGSKEEAKKKERGEKLTELQKREDREKLKKAGKKWGIGKEDSPKEATRKIVKGVLGEEYNPKEAGFQKMVDEITHFIQEQTPELKEKFDQWISVMKESL